MGRVISNAETVSFAREASLGVLPGAPQWFELEPNTIRGFGNTISKTTRTPISRARVRRKGSITDQDSMVEMELDLTLTHLRHFVECFCFAQAVGGDAYLTPGATGVAFQIPAALSAAQAGRLIYNAVGAKTLLYSYGFETDGNNGLKVLSAAAAAGDVIIHAAGLAIEAVAADQMAEVMIAGIRADVGDLSIDAGGNLVSLVLDLTTLGLTRGQVIHVGGVDALNQFATAANTGFARIEAIAVHKLTLSKRDQPFVADDGAGVAVDILFGQFVRNVPIDHVNFLQPSLQYELASPNLMELGETGYEYALGNWVDTISLALPLSGKATVTIGCKGTNTTDPTNVRALNAATAKVGGLTAAFGTASDIARLRVQRVDEEGLSTDFKSATFTLSNNVAGEKVLGVLGPKYMNAGNVECDVQAQMLFTDSDVIHAIRCNETVGLDWVLRNGDGGAAFDLPTGTLDGGNRDYPANQSVVINTTFAAHQEDDLDFTLGVSFFPVLPAQPC